VGATGPTVNGPTGATATLANLSYRVSKAIEVGKELKERVGTEISCKNTATEVAIGGGVTIEGGKGVVIAESVPIPSSGPPTGRKGAAVQSIYTGLGGNGKAGKFQVWVVCTTK
jgi:hypothetical protein